MTTRDKLQMIVNFHAKRAAEAREYLKINPNSTDTQHKLKVAEDYHQRWSKALKTGKCGVSLDNVMRSFGIDLPRGYYYRRIVTEHFKITKM